MLWITVYNFEIDIHNSYSVRQGSLADRVVDKYSFSGVVAYRCHSNGIVKGSHDFMSFL